MESIKADGELAAEMVALLGKELKVARKRIQELEENQTDVIELTKRAEGAETAMKILKKCAEDERAEKERYRQLANQCKKEPGDNSLLLLQDNNQIQETERLSEEKDEKIAALEKSVEKYREKYQKAREAKQRLQERCDEQEEKINSLTDRKDAPSQCQACDEVVSRSGSTREPRHMLNKRIGCLPKYIGRSNFEDILPVCHKGVDLRSYLDADPQSSPCTKKMLYVPGRLTWCTASKHHALAFGPMFAVDSEKMIWKENSVFNSLYGQTVELFYNCKDLIYYGGQYKCHNNRQNNPDGDLVQKETSAFELADVTITVNSGPGKHEALRKMIFHLYIGGILKTEILGLQCVGFDDELYNTLVKRFNMNNPSLKRGGSHRLDSDRKVKRAKAGGKF